MTAPIGAHVAVRLETVRYAMIEPRFVRITFVIWPTDALGNHGSVALLMAQVLAVRALIAQSVLEQLSAESAAHNVVELLSYKFVTVEFVDVFFALPDRALTHDASVKRLPFPSLLR